MIAHRVTRVAVPAALVLGAFAFAAPAQADVDSDVAALKAATEKYKDPAAAIADGFMKDDNCVSSPDGKGVMGYHYVNPKRLEAAPEVTKPPILVYQDDSKGGRKLVAVEYFKADKDQDLTTTDDKPSLFGKPFDGPMEGHNPTMPRHYDLHAWVWQDNPAGTFAVQQGRLLPRRRQARRVREAGFRDGGFRHGGSRNGGFRHGGPRNGRLRQGRLRQGRRRAGRQDADGWR